MPRQDNFPVAGPIFGEPVFNESGNPTPDPGAFSTPHPSDTQIYNQIQDLLTKDVVAFPQMQGQPGDLYSLATAYGPSGAQTVQTIQAQGQILFHVAGDSGASSSRKYADEISVADALSNDIHSLDPSTRHAFLFHVGDLVYDFCETQYWYDQFYDPFRNYPAPIFAIPGNHDSFVVPNTPAGQEPLTTFISNFCASQPVVTQEAGSLHRTAMTQPGVYFALDAPFVRIIGLFSNALEDPGVISSENGKWAGVPDFQLAFLTAQLQRVVSENYTGALIIAMHHPPFSYSPPPNGSGGGGVHGGSQAMLAQIDTICAAQNVYPHAILSGHAHNYQRYTRSITFNGSQIQVPFIIIGNSGHNVNPLTSARAGSPASEPNFGDDVSYLDANPVVQSTGLKIVEFDDANYGYLSAIATPTRLTITYNQAGGSGAGPGFTPVTVNLQSHTIS